MPRKARVEFAGAVYHDLDFSLLKRMSVIKYIAAAACLVVLVTAAVLGYSHIKLSPIRRGILSEQSWLLYHVDPEILASETRRFAKEQRSLHSAAQVFMGDDRRLPSSLGILKPKSVEILDGHARIEFGGLFLHYGVYVYDEGLTGPGTKELTNGVWFYAEDGRFPGPNGETKSGSPSGR